MNDFWTLIFSPAVEVAFRGRPGSLEKWPPSWKAAQLRFNPKGRHAGISQPMDHELVPTFVQAMQLYASCSESFNGMFFYFNGQNWKNHTQRGHCAVPDGFPSGTYPPELDMDYVLAIDNNDLEKDEQAFLDVAIEFTPNVPIGHPALFAMWRVDQAMTLLGKIIGSPGGACRHWNDIDLDGVGGKLGGFHGHASEFARLYYGIHKLQIYLNRKFLFFSHVRDLEEVRCTDNACSAKFNLAQVNPSKVSANKLDKWWIAFKDNILDYVDKSLGVRAEFRVEPWAVRPCLDALRRNALRFFASDCIATVEARHAVDIYLVHARVSYFLLFAILTYKPGLLAPCITSCTTRMARCLLLHPFSRTFLPL